jgi:REP element-mobilizing transposase RayT
MEPYIRRRNVTLLHAHLVFTTKYRRRVISGLLLATVGEAAYTNARKF